MISSDTAAGSVGYLGPPGTFTHQATLSHPALSGRSLVPMTDVAGVFSAVAHADLELGVVPWENSVAGMVGSTLDLLVEASPGVRVCNDMTTPIDLCLWGRPGAKLSNLQVIGSHPHALAQCRGWMRRHAPGAATRESASTAAALADVVRDATGGTAAIASPAAARQEGVGLLHSSIGDVPEAVTRFVVLSREYPRNNAECRTILACFQPHNNPGSLLTILKYFAAQGIELQRVESRPTRTGLGHYFFLIECMGNATFDPGLIAALASLTDLHVRCKVLGLMPGRVPEHSVGKLG
jgi:prephenate dehydratase